MADRDVATGFYGEQEEVEAREAHWDGVAEDFDTIGRWGRAYHRRLEEVYRNLIMPGSRVVELGCGQGDLLAGVKPSRGVGVDLSAKMIARGREKHPELEFIHADAAHLAPEEPFDYVIVSDLLDDLWDVQFFLRNLRAFCTPETRIVVNFYSRLWQPVLNVARRFGLATPLGCQNWLTREDVLNLLELEGMEAIRTFSDVLLPLDIPLLSRFTNAVLSKLPVFRFFDLCNVVVARVRPEATPNAPLPSVSVIVAARNEEGNIDEIFRRTPDMGSSTELIFVEGGSSDDTYGAVERAIAANPNRKASLYRQPGKGKGDAVRVGFDRAEGDVLMILDADMTVPPEDLPRFYEALVQGKGEFINGVRLVYPMERKAMRFFNLLGNKFFSLAFSWLLGQPIKDTLCGTKVLRRETYARIAANRSYFGEFDPFGDYDLIFGAARLNLKSVDLPIRYRERTYGAPNIQRWRDGTLLLRMVVFASRRIKFI